MSVDNDHGLGPENEGVNARGKHEVHPEYKKDLRESLPATELTRDELQRLLESGVVEHNGSPYWYEHNGLEYGITVHAEPDPNEDNAIAGVQVLYPETEGLMRTHVYILKQGEHGTELESSDIYTGEESGADPSRDSQDRLPEQDDDDEDYLIHEAMQAERALGLRMVSEAEARRVIAELKDVFKNGKERTSHHDAGESDDGAVGV